MGRAVALLLLSGGGAAQNQQGIDPQPQSEDPAPSYSPDGGPPQGWERYDGETIALGATGCTLIPTPSGARYATLESVNKVCTQYSCEVFTWDAEGTEEAQFFTGGKPCRDQKSAKTGSLVGMPNPGACFVDWVLGAGQEDCDAVCASSNMECQEAGFGVDSIDKWRRDVVSSYNEFSIKPKCNGNTATDPIYTAFGIAPALMGNGNCTVESTQSQTAKDLWCNRTAPVTHTVTPTPFVKSDNSAVVCPAGDWSQLLTPAECAQAAAYFNRGNNAMETLSDGSKPPRCFWDKDGNIKYNQSPDFEAVFTMGVVCMTTLSPEVITVIPGFGSRCKATAKMLQDGYQRICPCAKAEHSCAMPAGKTLEGSTAECLFDAPTPSYAPKYVHYTGGKPDYRVDGTEAPAYSAAGYDPRKAEEYDSLKDHDTNYTGVYGSVAKYDYVDPRTGTVMAPPPALIGYPYWVDGLHDGTQIHAGYATDIENAGAYWSDGDTKVSNGNQNPGTNGSGIPQASSCTGQGLVCDFREENKLTSKEYSPLDFVWKIIDPSDMYMQDGYNMRTMNCEVDIRTPDQDTERNYTHFYVPLGVMNKQHKFSANGYPWCDVNGVLREINNEALEMKDTIRIRAETARLDDKGESQIDLIGEFFDLTCSCTTKLQTVASLDMIQNQGALSTVMTGTDQSRTLDVELHLFSDDLLQDRVTGGQQGTPIETFPSWSERFFFLARHTYDGDWDVMVQINKCVVCDMAVHQRHIDDTPGVVQGPACRTDAINEEAVTFFDQCDFVRGGPKMYEINAASWYHDSTVDAHVYSGGDGGGSTLNSYLPPAGAPECSGTHDYNNGACYTNWKPNGDWAEQNSTRCPYHAIGMQKFGVVGADAVYISCAVTACTERPCLPCTANYAGADRRQRRQLRAMPLRKRRQLQQFGESELALGISFGEPTAATSGNEEGASTPEKKASLKSTIVLLLVVLILGVVAVAIMRRQLERRAASRGVLPEGAKADLK